MDSQGKGQKVFTLCKLIMRLGVDDASSAEDLQVFNSIIAFLYKVKLFLRNEAICFAHNLVSSLVVK